MYVQQQVAAYGLLDRAATLLVSDLERERKREKESKREARSSSC